MEGGIAILLLLILVVIGGVAMAVLGTSSWLARHKAGGVASAADHPREVRAKRTPRGGTRITHDTGSARESDEE